MGITGTEGTTKPTGDKTALREMREGRGQNTRQMSTIMWLGQEKVTEEGLQGDETRGRRI